MEGLRLLHQHKKDLNIICKFKSLNDPFQEFSNHDYGKKANILQIVNMNPFQEYIYP